MARYTNIPTTLSPNDKRMYKTVRYPQIPRSFEDIYVYTTTGDRYDTLAHRFYQDSRLWWIIASCNNSKTDSLAVQPGIQLRIPSKPTDAINLYNTINANR